MAKKYLAALLLVCASCSSKSSVITYSEYTSVESGMTVEQMEEKLGKPYAIHNRKDGSQEYEYIERITAGSGTVSENHYFLIVQKGSVTGKYMKSQQSPPYDLIYQEQPNYSP